MKKKQKVMLWFLVVFILPVFFFLFLEKTRMMSIPIVSGLQNSVIEKQWTHREILKGELGSIYTLGARGRLLKLKIGTDRWEKIESPPICPERWGISKAMLACFTSYRDMDEGKISLFSVPDLKPLNTIVVDKDAYDMPMLCPDRNGKYVAVIGINKMRILSAKNGEKVFEVKYGDYGIYTVDWSRDSRRILFSCRYKNSALQPFGLSAMPFITVYDLDTKISENICKGWGPKWDKSENKIIFRKSESIYSYGDIFEFDRKTNKEKLLLRNIRLYDYDWSPSGDNLLVAIPQKRFFYLIGHNG